LLAPFDPEELPHGIPKRTVRARRSIGLCPERQHCGIRVVRKGFLGESALPTPGIADDGDDPPPAGRPFADRGSDLGEFWLAADEGEIPPHID
jgi:hypothetical protein